jgi:hypothetical protein
MGQMKAEKKHGAISCNSSAGPCFGDDIGVSDNCNAASTYGYSDIGRSYANDTGLDGKNVFTGCEPPFLPAATARDRVSPEHHL